MEKWTHTKDALSNADRKRPHADHYFTISRLTGLGKYSPINGTLIN